MSGSRYSFIIASAVDSAEPGRVSIPQPAVMRRLSGVSHITGGMPMLIPSMIARLEASPFTVVLTFTAHSAIYGAISRQKPQKCIFPARSPARPAFSASDLIFSRSEPSPTTIKCISGAFARHSAAAFTNTSWLLHGASLPKIPATNALRGIPNLFRRASISFSPAVRSGDEPLGMTVIISGGIPDAASACAAPRLTAMACVAVARWSMPPNGIFFTLSAQ